jgi:hypothetical protein
MNFVHE